MAFEQKPGFGTLFQNTRKSKDTQPDITGELHVEGVGIVRFAGWKKEGQRGSFYSLRVDASERQTKTGTDGQDIPF